LFESEDDVWNIINKLIKETKEVNKNMGKNFKISSSILSQLPFFACRNIILNKESQDDIARYVYSNEFSTPAYKGSYGEQPARWVKKSFIIKTALNNREQKIANKNLKDK
jgi:hypothetical protein